MKVSLRMLSHDPNYDYGTDDEEEEDDMDTEDFEEWVPLKAVGLGVGEPLSKNLNLPENWPDLFQSLNVNALNPISAF